MSFLDSLNLRPQEKRLLVVGLALAVVVLSALWVWPRLGEWRKAHEALEKSRKTLQSYEAEIARIPTYEARLAELEGQGSAVLQEEQALQLLRTVQLQAQQHHVTITSTRAGLPGPTTSTNAFFDEQTVQIGVNTGEKELVQFLLALGSGGSLIRVRDMDLRPDPPRFRLNGTITLVASYQKKPKTTRPPASAPPAVARAHAPTNPTLPRKP